MTRGSASYLEIAGALRQEILSRDLAAHTRLPSEPELVERYRAARATVRRAIAKLQEEGLVYSRRAVGTFVAEPRVEQDLDQLFSFTELMVYRGRKPGTRLIESRIEKIDDPNSPILRDLALRPGSRVRFVRRLRLGGQAPLVIAQTWLAAARFPGFAKHDLERESIYDIMGESGWRPTDAVQTLEAVTLNAEQAALLTVAEGSPALRIHRIAFAQGTPVESAVDLYRGDRTALRVRLGVLEQRLRGHR